MRGYRAGDFWRVCDVCGFECRASETRKRWDGLIVCLPDYEERHPQDFVRGRVDRQRVPEARPQPTDVFLSESSGSPIGILLVFTTASRNLG